MIIYFIIEEPCLGYFTEKVSQTRSYRSLWAKPEAVPRKQRFLVHGVQPAFSQPIRSQQIAQKNKDGFHRRSHDRPIPDDGRVQALSAIILHARKAKVTNKISGQLDSAAEQAAGGVNKHP